MRYLRHTLAVLGVTVLTTAAVYSGISAFGQTDAGTELAENAVQTCPRTGCTSVGCHATDGSAAYPSGGMTGTHGLRGRI